MLVEYVIPADECGLANMDVAMSHKPTSNLHTVALFAGFASGLTKVAVGVHTTLSFDHNVHIESAWFRYGQDASAAQPRLQKPRCGSCSDDNYQARGFHCPI